MNAKSETSPDTPGEGRPRPRISPAPPLSLAQALAEIGQTPNARDTVAKIAAAISRQLRRPVLVDDLIARAKDSRSTAELFAVSVPDLIQGFARTAATPKDDKPEAEETSHRLPSKVPWEDAPRYFVHRDPGPQQLHGNLYKYAIPSMISPEEFKTRSAMGEILDRLALNRSVAEERQFRLAFRQAEYSDFDTFIEALVETGHQIEVDISTEVSDFLHLMMQQEDGTLREVQTEMPIRTGYFTDDGKEITVPVVHSHLIFRIAGQQVTTAVEFYQGVFGTHFYPSGVTQGESWVGIRTTATYGGTQALTALRAAGLYLDLLTNISRKDKLFAGGYGQSGVCNDSVAIIEILIKEEPTVYPLLINKRLVVSHIDALVKERPKLAIRYGELRDAIEQMPLDDVLHGSQPRRILASIPYEPGLTPHVGYNDARRYLTSGETLATDA